VLTPCPPPPKIITDVIGNPEEERRAEFYQQPWAQEAVGRHIFAKVGSVLCRWAAAVGRVGSRGVPGAAPLPASLPSSPPGPAASAGTGTSARDPPDLRGRRGLGSSFSSPCCLSLTVLLTGIKHSTCTNPTCLEGFGAARAPGLPSARTPWPQAECGRGPPLPPVPPKLPAPALLLPHPARSTERSPPARSPPWAQSPPEPLPAQPAASQAWPCPSATKVLSFQMPAPPSPLVPDLLHYFCEQVL